MADMVNGLESLEPAGYRPIWSNDTGYPGDVPEDLADWLYPGIEKTTWLVGDLSSMFWLAGKPELQVLIDDPGYTLTDEICYIPHGGSLAWLFESLYHLGKIPSFVYAEIYNNTPDYVTPFSGRQIIPNSVTSPMTVYNVIPPSIASEIENQFASSLGRGLLFQGLSRVMLQSLMAFFTPALTRSNMNNEFGPGFYTTPSLEYALGYAGPQGVILVFKDVDFRRLNCLEPTGADWVTITTFWSGRTTSNVHERVPQMWATSDVVTGPVSTALQNTRVPGEVTQVVGTSPPALAAFMRSLAMIIWLE
ncbi:hypothetical protein N7466_003221 [Penicillium verhagenii]|uniref:uncharacterized protein n=1 Tax=Penicillium verhagenii TaxID=1562060 RepID=UPI0025451832|nr:uncharacterized protein N7466_003221 [Penicillium verhagenii]KAJ5936771.1 hypothetical protein N7466_003221 [Penicillium verhagenii]